MIKKAAKFFFYLALLGIVMLSFLVFYPRKYDVPQLQKRESTQYWNLQTGSKIAYILVAAKGEKKPFPIIFLQGGPGGIISNRTIEMLAPLANDGYDIYLYDQIGSGYSDRLADITQYTADRHKADLAAIVEQIGAEKVILIGQSWGGILATLYIAEHADKVAKAIFTCPGPIQPANREIENRKAPDSLHLKEPLYTNAQANSTTKTIRSQAVTQLAYLFGSKLASDKEMDDFQTVLVNRSNKSIVCDTTKALAAQGGNGFYVQIMTIFSLAEIKDPRQKLKEATFPVLIMKGQCDNQKWGFTQEYAEIFPNARLVVIPNAGHSIGVEQPGLYLQTIREFLGLY